MFTELIRRLPTQLLLVCLVLHTAPSHGQKLQQYCKFTPQHTLCRTSGLGKACGNTVPSRGVSEKDAAVIVAQHNQLRAMVALGQERRGSPGPQPKAANMMEMEWDEELAVIAQRHADQCVFEHDCADCRQVDRFSSGQNLFISFQSDMEPSIHWPRAMQAWYDEVGLFNRAGVQSYNFEPSTGHYTQLVWSSASHIGCGFTMYKEGGWYKKLYTCNYGPAGNVIFTPMYTAGEPCSQCPPDTSCSLAYPGLCTANTNSKSNTPSQNIAKQRQRTENIPVGQRKGTDTNQPFQVFQPFQLLESSGFAKPTFTPKRTQTTTTTTTAAPSTFGSRVQQNRQSNQTSDNNESVQNFLMKFGKDSQVIRTNSLDSVRAIINSLPADSQPLVFFRSNMGTIRQLNSVLLKGSGNGKNKESPPTGAPKRKIRSTVTPAMLQDVDVNSMLLSCQDVSQPCPVVALSGNWSHDKESNTNVVRSLMSPGGGGQLVLGQTIPAPNGEAVCVTLSHIFRGKPGSVVPDVHVGVWPLGQVLLQEELSEVSVPEDDGWMMTKVSFAPIRNPFMVVLSVEPNPNADPVEVALRGFMVTQGLCSK